MISLPLVVVGLAAACGGAYCLGPSPLGAFRIDVDALVSLDALVVVCGWLAFQALLQIALPGPRAQGVVLPDGSRLTYVCGADSSPTNRGAAAGRG